MVHHQHVLFVVKGGTLSLFVSKRMGSQVIRETSVSALIVVKAIIRLIRVTRNTIFHPAIDANLKTDETKNEDDGQEIKFTKQQYQALMALIKPVEELGTIMQKPSHISSISTSSIESGNIFSYITIIDDFSRFSWVYLMHNKSETRTHLTNFINHVENQFETKVKIRLKYLFGPNFRKLF